jgi:hypothetical protein
MSRRPAIAGALTDALPALVVTGAAAVGISRQVPELADRLPAVAIAGLVAVLVAQTAVAIATARADRATLLAPSAMPTARPEAEPSVAPAGSPLPPPRDVPASGFEGFSSPKIGASPEENEDAWLVDANTGLIAVSDGASSSFGASVWSRALVEAATVTGGSNAEFVAACVQRAAAVWTARHTSGEVAWWAQEGMRRGAFATLLVVRIGGVERGRSWTALAVGDSCVFHLRRAGHDWTLVGSFPLSTPEEFGSHPDLLSSVAQQLPTPVTTAGALQSGDVLLAATDAVSEWLLTMPSRLAFAAVADVNQFAEVVMTARHERTMVNDDATVVRYREP